MIYLVVVIFGLIFGSFLNVCIVRLPRQQLIVLPGALPAVQTPHSLVR